MKSPFPGMDSYIETCGFWPDFHDDLISEVKRALAGVLPRKYRVRTELREVVELVETEGKEKRSIYPDVKVTGPWTHSPEGGVAVAEPETAAEGLALRPFIAEEFREKFIEISVAEGERRLVTCIEVLSPSNKRANSAS